jgi:hypothetical protein
MDFTSAARRDIDSKIDVPVTPNTELTIKTAPRLLIFSTIDLSNERQC